MTNSIGDKGSPWRSPRAWQIRLPGLPFNRMRVLAVDRRIEIQFLHLELNPKCYNNSNKNGQETESNALAISIFRRTHGALDA